jgi:hypothetical protein
MTSNTRNPKATHRKHVCGTGGCVPVAEALDNPVMTTLLNPSKRQNPLGLSKQNQDGPHQLATVHHDIQARSILAFHPR